MICLKVKSNGQNSEKSCNQKPKRKGKGNLGKGMAYPYTKYQLNMCIRSRDNERKLNYDGRTEKGMPLPCHDGDI